MKKEIFIGASVLLLLGGGFWLSRLAAKKDTPKPQQIVTEKTEQGGFDRALHATDEPGSPWWIVNKQRPLANDYKPAEMTAPNMKLRWAADAETMQISAAIAPSLEAMAKAAMEAGHELMLISGYRSAAYQKELYEAHIRQYGQAEADRQSAKPGTSEHQTGLAMDLGRADKECELTECFGNTPQGKWLAEHAHEYGFIIRYLNGKERFTGYMYEPWHLRYVGKELAAELRAKNQTMEEFFRLAPTSQ